MKNTHSVTPDFQRSQAIFEMVEELVEAEGHSITIVCPNPDFNGLPDRAVDLIHEKTGWVEKRFGGRTLFDALEAAVRFVRGNEGGAA